MKTFVTFGEDHVHQIGGEVFDKDCVAVVDGAFEMHACWVPWGLLELTQREADDLLYTGMRADGCSKYLAGKAWAGVRAGGWTQWPKDHITLANAQRSERARQIPADSMRFDAP